MSISRQIINLEKIYKAAYEAGSPDNAKGFSGWQKRAQITRKALMKAQEERDATVAEWKRSYTNAALAPKLDELNEEYSQLRKIAIDRLDGELVKVVDEKRKQFRTVAMSAPSEEQLRTLQALSLRDDLTTQEVSEMAETMSNSLQAMRALGSIARKAGLFFPKLITNEEFEDQLNDAASYARSNYDLIDVPEKALGYNGVSFFNYTDTGLAKLKFSAVDRPLYAAVQEAQEANEKPVTTEAAAGKTGKGDAVPMWAEVTTTDNMSIGVLASQFHVSPQQIRDANPGVYLDNLKGGVKILVPSTRFTFQPDPSGAHAQPHMVKAVPVPKRESPTGPDGEKSGSDIHIRNI